MKNLLEYIDEAIVKKPRTTEYNGIYGIYKPIDLGLSVKWANCNVGAKKPEDPGLLFQWGRTDGYRYGDKKHKFLNQDNYITISGKKYNNNDILDLVDDAAAANMNGTWRMPTYEEFEELFKKTKNTWMKQCDINGMLFTADNGNSIFMPVTGYFDYTDNTFGLGKGNVLMLSSTAEADNCANTVDLDFDFYHMYATDMGFGMGVRGVCE